MRKFFKALLTPPLMLLAALLMFAEEVIWEGLKRIMAVLGRLPLIRSVEAWIATLPPYGAAVVFLAPGAMLLPVKLGALWLIANGHALFGVELIVAAKLVGTALVARIFTITKPALMTLAWFASMHGWIMRWREKLYAFVKASAMWQRLEQLRAVLRAMLRHLRPGHVGRRFRAIQRMNRRAAFR
jgi:hypothetical protein